MKYNNFIIKIILIEINMKKNYTIIFLLIFLMLIIIIPIILYFNIILRKYSTKNLLTIEGINKIKLPSSKIRKLCITYKKKPKKEIMERFNQDGFKLEFFNDKDCLKYLKKYYTNIVVNRYNYLKKKKYHAHAADIFRFAYLYLEGGVYLDIKTIPKVPLKEIFPPDKLVVCNSGFSGLHIGVLGGRKKEPFFIKMVAYISQAPVYIFINYFINTIQAGRFITETKSKNLIRLQEKCEDKECKYQNGKEDRWGICCGIYKKKKRVMNTRDVDYPEKY